VQVHPHVAVQHPLALWRLAIPAIVCVVYVVRVVRVVCVVCFACVVFRVRGV
jgi:hypothetical protein